jgi:molybdate transport system substrate-binding protein
MRMIGATPVWRAALLVFAATALAAQEPAIAAASDLSSALPEIAELFRKETGHGVRLTFGSSGNLAQQIINGAPFEVFLSADEGYVARVSAAGRADGPGRVYAIGRIGLFIPKRSRIVADSQLAGLSAAVRSGFSGKFSIANPDHAPYGRAARDALVHAGIWEGVRQHLVFGENASQAAQFAVSGAAVGGIIPLSLAHTAAVRAAGTFTLIPAAWHQPLRQEAVLVRNASQTARTFFEFLRSPGARAVFERFGFPAQLPD